MKSSLLDFLRACLNSLRDLLPIVFVVAFFQLAVLQQPLPDFLNILVGLLLVVLGLTFLLLVLR